MTRLPFELCSGTLDARHCFLAILPRRRVIHGVTTAASPWLVTVIGLSFGTGLLGLGIAALAIALVVLWMLKWC